MPGPAPSLPERQEISYALIQNPDTPWATIATRINRHPTTIAREIRRNGGRNHYRAGLADRRALRSAHRPRPRRLQTLGPLRTRITNELSLGRSPVAIWADLTAEGTKQAPCVETIYTTVYAGVFDVKAVDCLRMRRPRRRNRQTRHHNRRPALPNINNRPANVGDRTELGHWEADQIIGAHNRSSMLSLTERVTRYSILVTTRPRQWSAASWTASTASRGICCDRSPLATDPSGRTGKPSPLPTASIAGFVNPIRRGNAARSKTSTVNGGGGSHAARTLAGLILAMPITSPTSSTGNADANSTTNHPLPSMLQPQTCTDH
ncbi:MAG: hypothetical protein ACI8Y4_002672 [Candidatus Poriferisodalaceae bacterium]|jgi:hypothetical protein